MAEKILFEKGWKFHLGDIEPRPIQGHDVTYQFGKAEHARDAAARDYDDAAWQTVRLPHDYIVGGTPSPEFNHDHGSLKRDNGWYRRTFKLNDKDRDCRHAILFDGVAVKCTVWVNGFRLKHNFTGGIGFTVDFTDVAGFGEEVNVVSVYVDNSEFEGWWYEGGGIYRHVYLVKSPKLHILPNGIGIRPKKSGDKWRVFTDIKIKNDGENKADSFLRVRLLDNAGKPVAERTINKSIAPMETVRLDEVFEIEEPELWNMKNPKFYYAELTLNGNGGSDSWRRVHTPPLGAKSEGMYPESNTLKEQHTPTACGGVVDSETVRFGLRELEFNPDNGFFLNGENIKLKGMCVHQDHSGLGAAVPDSVVRYRLERLKSMGVNAYRCSHHPPSPEVLDYCDEMGILVMDECRWLDSSEEGVYEAVEMVRRDLNHPSIIFWSILNEEPIMDRDTGRKIAARLYHAIKEIDDTRPVTGAMLQGINAPGSMDYFDVIGVNYMLDEYDNVMGKNPDKAFYGSETRCGYNPDGIKTWRLTDTNKRIMGTFPWTGIRYRGEAIWPFLFSRSGCLDAVCEPTDNYYLYKSWWVEDPVVHISENAKTLFRSANEQTAEEPMEITVFTNGDEAELFLDGKSLGKKKADPYEMAAWKLPMRRAKEIKALVWKNNGKWAEEVMAEEKAPAALRLRRVWPEDGKEINTETLFIIAAEAVDEDGKPVSNTGGISVHWEVRGDGKLAAQGNGSRTEHTAGESIGLYEGICHAFIRSKEGGGDITVKAASITLGTAEYLINLAGAPRKAQVPVTDSRYIYLWRESPATREKPQPDGTQAHENWKWRDVGRGSAMIFENIFPRRLFNARTMKDIRGYCILRAESVIPRCFDNKGTEVKSAVPVLHFELIDGKADILVQCNNNTFRTKKDKTGGTAFDFEIPGCAGGQEAVIWVYIEADTPFCTVRQPVRWLFKDV